MNLILRILLKSKFRHYLKGWNDGFMDCLRKLYLRNYISKDVFEEVIELEGIEVEVIK